MEDNCDEYVPIPSLGRGDQVEEQITIVPSIAGISPGQITGDYPAIVELPLDFFVDWTIHQSVHPPQMPSYTTTPVGRGQPVTSFNVGQRCIYNSPRFNKYV
jgi:hypothetical protein